jgi:hypothetical protein
MNNEVSYIEYTPSDNINASSSSEGGYVKGVVTYMVMDNLEVKPMSTISSITLLTKFNVRDLTAVEEKVVDFGMDEVIYSSYPFLSVYVCTFYSCVLFFLSITMSILFLCLICCRFCVYSRLL